jgi:hypothetical protein
LIALALFASDAFFAILLCEQAGSTTSIVGSSSELGSFQPSVISGPFKLVGTNGKELIA